MRTCPNSVLHPWLKEQLSDILQGLPQPEGALDPALNRPLWCRWQQSLRERFTLPEQLPCLRMLLVWDNLAGHKSAEMVLWLCAQGVMPLYTPLSGSWL